MNSPKHLLVPTDFSIDADHAAERAAMIAARAGASLDLIHVARTAPLEALRRLVAEVPADVEQRVLDKERSELRAKADAIEQRHATACGTHVVAGALMPELLGHAAAVGADLCLLGARGTSHLRHFLLGSTAERLVSRAPFPCLVIKQAPHAPYRNVLVPVDFSPASLQALLCAREVAPDAELVALHVFEVPFEGKLKFAGVEEEDILHFRNAAKKEAMQKLRELCDQASIPLDRISLRVIHGVPAHHIIEQEHAHHCDLIVIGRHDRNALEEFLLGSVARHVLAESRCDVLIAI